MKKFIFLPVVLFSIMVIVSCEKDYEVNQTLLLNKSWTESYEERTSEETRIFRPDDYHDFPLSMYRQVFYFGGNNNCEYKVLAEDDGHYMAKGTWQYNERTDIIKIYNSDSKKLFEFKVVTLTDEVLKLKKHGLPPPIMD